MEPSPTESEPRAVERIAPRGEEAHAEPVLGYAARPSGARRLWRWNRPGSMLFFVGVAVLAAGAGWGAWKWRLAADRKAFEACATISSGSGLTVVTFTHAPSRGALRHLSRLPGPMFVSMEWPESENVAAAQAFGAADLGNVSAISMDDTVNADLLLKELARPDSGLKSLTVLNLADTKVSDVGLKELARLNSGLKALTKLSLDGSRVTDAGLAELARPESGLKALSKLYIAGTKVTDAGVKALQATRPGLTIRR